MEEKSSVRYFNAEDAGAFAEDTEVFLCELCVILRALRVKST